MTYINEENREEVKDYIDSAVTILMAIDAEKEALKSITSSIKDSLGIPPKVFNTWIKQNYEGKLAEKIAELTEMKDSYDAIYIYI